MGMAATVVSTGRLSRIQRPMMARCSTARRSPRMSQASTACGGGGVEAEAGAAAGAHGFFGDGEREQEEEPASGLLQEGDDVLDAAIVLIEAGADLGVVRVGEEPVVVVVAPDKVGGVEGGEEPDPEDNVGAAEDERADAHSFRGSADLQDEIAELEQAGDAGEERTIGAGHADEGPDDARSRRPAYAVATGALAQVEHDGDEGEGSEERGFEAGGGPHGPGAAGAQQDGGDEA